MYVNISYGLADRIIIYYHDAVVVTRLSGPITGKIWYYCGPKTVLNLPHRPRTSSYQVGRAAARGDKTSALLVGEEAIDHTILLGRNVGQTSVYAVLQHVRGSGSTHCTISYYNTKHIVASVIFLWLAKTISAILIPIGVGEEADFPMAVNARSEKGRRENGTHENAQDITSDPVVTMAESSNICAPVWLIIAFYWRDATAATVQNLSTITAN